MILSLARLPSFAGATVSVVGNVWERKVILHNFPG